MVTRTNTNKILSGSFGEFGRLVGLFLTTNIALDFLTTLAAYLTLGAGGEANPIIRFAMQRGGVAGLVAVYLVSGGLLTCILKLTHESLDKKNATMRRIFGGWLVGFSVLGLVVAANNVRIVLAYGII